MFDRGHFIGILQPFDDLESWSCARACPFSFTFSTLPLLRSVSSPPSAPVNAELKIAHWIMKERVGSWHIAAVLLWAAFIVAVSGSSLPATTDTPVIRTVVGSFVGFNANNTAHFLGIR